MAGAVPVRSAGFGLVPIVLTAAYPLAIYFGLSRSSTELTAWVILAVFMIQVPLLLISRASAFALLGCSAVALAALSAALMGAKAPLLLAPALTNAALGAMFFGSLFQKASLVERLARLRDPAFTGEKAKYCRHVTQVWTAFFLANCLIIVALALAAPLSWWVLYTGLGGYLLAAILGITELFVRVRRFGTETGGVVARMLIPQRFATKTMRRVKP